MTDRKTTTAGFWVTVALVAVLLGYPLSFGPACWITSRINAGSSAIPVLYGPLTWTMSPKDEATINRVSTWYAKVGAAENWEWGAVSDSADRHVGWYWGYAGSR